MISSIDLTGSGLGLVGSSGEGQAVGSRFSVTTTIRGPTILSICVVLTVI